MTEMTLIVGSVAAEYIGIDLGREPSDVDLICTDAAHVDVPHTDAFWDERLRPYFDSTFADSPVLSRGKSRYATLDELYTLKVSHSHWELENRSWGKHMSDQLKLRAAGAKLIFPLYKTLYEIWEQKHGSKKANLSLESGEFFKDAVRRIYDHDSIHYSVAFADRPLYESVLRDGHSVEIDSAKMWALDKETLIRLFLEEIYATALERIMIPSNYEASASFAYHWALKRTITSLTRGRSSRFISLNFERFAHYVPGYLQRHLDKKHLLIPLEDGKVTA